MNSATAFAVLYQVFDWQSLQDLAVVAQRQHVENGLDALEVVELS
jgi:hypothetical protein